MPFALKKRETVPDAVCRVIDERLDNALAALDDYGASLSDERVHQARKQFKQVRGTLRLVRGELGEKRFIRENTTFRDAGRPLSAVRDAKVLVDTLDSLLEHFQQVDVVAFRRLRQALIDRRRDIRRRTLESEHAVSKVAGSITVARKRIAGWHLRHPGWKALSGGLRRVYSQGRRAMIGGIRGRLRPAPAGTRNNELRRNQRCSANRGTGFQPVHRTPPARRRVLCGNTNSRRGGISVQRGRTRVLHGET